MIFNFVKNLFSSSRIQAGKRRKSKNAGLGSERLEDRRLLAVYTVNSPLDVEDFDPTTTTLRQALELANADHDRDTIVFDFDGPTTIELTTTINQGRGDFGKPLDILSDLEIIGPGADQLTIAPGDDLERRAFVVHDHGTPKVMIRDLSISGFHTAENYINPDKPNTEHGPAITNWASLNLINVVVHDNSTIFSGGAIYNAGTLMVDSGIFANNLAADGGGAIYSHDTRQIGGDSTLTIKNSVFEQNMASRGGAIYNHNQVDNGWQEYAATAVMVVHKSVFLGNQATDGHGGAIYSARAGLEVHQSEFVQNVARIAGNITSRGGAIYTHAPNINHNNFKPETVIMDSTFELNFAERGGAINFTADQSIRLINSTFTANHASFQGGALFFYSIFGTATLTNNTIIENSVGGSNGGVGGGIYSQDNDSISLPRLFNNIVSNNRKINGNPSNYWGFFHSSSNYNLVGAADAAQTGPGLHINNFIDDFDEDPGLEPLANNGGPTRTHAISGKESDALNSGDPLAHLRNGIPLFDQRGVSRIEDGRIDIGSFEAANSLRSGDGFSVIHERFDEFADSLAEFWIDPIDVAQARIELAIAETKTANQTVGDSENGGWNWDLAKEQNLPNDELILLGLDDEFEFWTFASEGFAT